MWEVKYITDKNKSYKALCMENNKINVSLLSDEFLQKIIKIHNDESSESYHEGVKDGVQIVKNSVK